MTPLVFAPCVAVPYEGRRGFCPSGGGSGAQVSSSSLFRELIDALVKGTALGGSWSFGLGALAPGFGALVERPPMAPSCTKAAKMVLLVENGTPFERGGLYRTEVPVAQKPYCSGYSPLGIAASIPALPLVPFAVRCGRTTCVFAAACDPRAEVYTNQTAFRSIVITSEPRGRPPWLCIRQNVNP